MRYQEALNCSANDLRNQLNIMIQNLLANCLKVEGETVVIPTDRELDLKLKYDVNEDGHSFALKLSWDNVIEEDD